MDLTTRKGEGVKTGGEEIGEGMEQGKKGGNGGTDVQRMREGPRGEGEGNRKGNLAPGVIAKNRCLW